MKVIPIDNKGTQADEQLSRREKVLLDPLGAAQRSDDSTTEEAYEYKHEMPVIFPFGPPVYTDMVSEFAVNELDELIVELGGKIEFDASGRLAGRILKQSDLSSGISEDLHNELLMHCDRFSHYATGESGMPLQLDGIWSNIQEAREFNPPHSHSGNFSFVVYCRNDLDKLHIDEIQDNEYDTPHEVQGEDTTNRKLAGMIELKYGEDNYMNWTGYQHIPKRRDIIIFPSWLRHVVFAHYEENAVRISVAGNVSIVDLPA